MEKTYKAYVALVLTEGFNLMLHKNGSVNFMVFYSHKTSMYLLLGLCLLYAITKNILLKYLTTQTLIFWTQMLL